jgi:general secretion pathway protein G
MIVIVILGVLAGIVVFSVQFIDGRGDHAACQTNLKDVQSAVEAYYAKFGEYPPAGVGSQADIGTPHANDSLIGAGVLRDPPLPGTWNIDSDGLVTVTGGACA